MRDTIDTFLKVCFPNSNLTKSIGAAAMIKDSSKRFTNMGPSLKNHDKRADFSVISNKSNHLILSVEAKSNKTKRISDLVKLCRELKDAMKAIHSEGYSSVPICRILMKGNCCNIYVMDHIFDELYRIAMIKRIYLPRDYYEMNQLLLLFFYYYTYIQKDMALKQKRPFIIDLPCVFLLIYI